MITQRVPFVITTDGRDLSPTASFCGQDLLSISRIDGYGFDLELLYIAQRRGYQIAEVPINWADQPGSKVLVLRDGLRMFCELLAVRRNDGAGRYNNA